MSPGAGRWGAGRVPARVVRGAARPAIGLAICLAICLATCLAVRPGIAQGRGAGGNQAPQVAPPGWRELGAGAIRVAYTAGDSLLAVEVLEWALAQPPLPGLPDGIPSRARIVLAPSEAAWDSITRGSAPEWSAAVARPALAELVLPAYSSSRGWFTEQARTLRHEWAHLGLHEYLAELRIPRWFDEGYAERASGSWDAEAAWRLRVAIAVGSVPELDSLDLGWPRAGVDARNAYFLSATAVEALEGNAGARGLRLFFDEWRSTRSFDLALATIYGHTISSLERAWRGHLKQRYNWLWVASRVLAGWTFLVFIALVMRTFRRGRMRERWAELRARDPEVPDNPEYYPEASESQNLPPTGG